MMTYKGMLKGAKERGLVSDKIMWDSVDSLSAMLCDIKDEHPRMYWNFMREQHGLIFNDHYDKEFAEMDVEKLHYTDSEGKDHCGAKWSCDQIEDATKSMSFPNGTTTWDKYVAFNVMWSDTCKVSSEEQVINNAYQFFFADEDFAGKNKIWDYMCMVAKG